eukprot:CAMPEP_0184650424 /NCGR_PEP_ID=MMETSP0308-20130426/7949_1 /TAXON_ID=38269 /ORGANISM="Gloeochaete witrockiana, Strain SAG 46.84" /LENGTH=686 /DNA_ID=CAMNT_0027083933 /DNA_START=561 /DNA_END=2621 /DNA_ORIENTATION=+
MAESLASSSDQYNVTVLWVYPKNVAPLDPLVVEEYELKHITLVSLEHSALEYDAPWHRSVSYQVYLHLKDAQPPYHIAHFHAWRGIAHYSVLARWEGLAVHSTVICIALHATTMWRTMSNLAGPTADDLEFDYMERVSLERADVVWSPSQYLIDWVSSPEGSGWTLPAYTFRMPLMVPKRFRQVNPNSKSQSAGNHITFNEVVFVGKFDAQSGLDLFCSAIDGTLKELFNRGADWETRLKITLIGTSTSLPYKSKEWRLSAEQYLRMNRAPLWDPIPFEIVIENRTEVIVSRLRNSPHAFAVVPPLVETTPYSIIEFLRTGVPFITTAVGGIPELIHPGDHSSVLVDASSKALTQKILDVLDGGLTPPRFDPTLTASYSFWPDWHMKQLSRAIPRKQGKLKDSSLPLVSIVLVHYNRPNLLAQAIDSIIDQTYKKIEVVLVDDGSTDETAKQYVKRIEKEFKARGWKIVIQENMYLGAARNTGVRHSTGKYVMFMDDDNYAKNEEVETFVNVALRINGEILTCPTDYLGFTQDPPLWNQVAKTRWLPLGGYSPAGAFRNVFGDANCFIRRDIFEKIGGFTEDYGLGHEDWEFYSKASLMGVRLDLIPDALYWYRASQGSMQQSALVNPALRYANLMRNVRPYLDTVPQELRSLVLYTQGLKYRMYSHFWAFHKLTEYRPPEEYLRS